MKLTDYTQPSVTADVVIFNIVDGKLKVLLIKRGVKPFRGSWAIPGGFVREDEDLFSAAERELYEETGVENSYLEQLYTFGDTGRDPRGRVISVAYMALARNSEVELKASSDASDVKWFDIEDLPDLAFDHKKIFDYALKRLRWKFEYTCIGFSVLPKRFSLGALQKVYEIVFDRKIDKRNFRKKVLGLGILKEVGVEEGVAYRPAKLYSLKVGFDSILRLSLG